LPTEWQVIAFLPSVRNLAFLLFGGAVEALLLSGTVGSAGSLCSVGRKLLPGTENQRRALSSKVRIPLGQ
jgi:hypothetical protein